MALFQGKEVPLTAALVRGNLDALRLTDEEQEQARSFVARDPVARRRWGFALHSLQSYDPPPTKEDPT